MADVLRSLNLLEVLKEFVEKKGPSEVKEAVEDLLISRVNIAVVGESSPEKTTLLNSLRGLGPGDGGAAQFPSPSPQKELIVYPKPKHPDIRLWDLPVVPDGSPFDPEDYKKVKFLRYNAVIVTSSQMRFCSNSALVWREARSLQREAVYFALLASERDSRESMEPRRKASQEALGSEGLASPRVFLVRGTALEALDFPELLEEMWRDVPEVKAAALPLALPALSVAVVTRKRDALKALLWAAASLSGGVSAIPMPLVSSAVDAGVGVRILSKARDSLGLDDASLEGLARRRGRDGARLKALRACPLSQEVTKGAVKKLLAAAEKQKPTGARVVEMALPGTTKSASRSFTTMFLALNGAIDDMAADAERVVAAAVGGADWGTEFFATNLREKQKKKTGGGLILFCTVHVALRICINLIFLFITFSCISCTVNITSDIRKLFFLKKCKMI
ncbi:interferon-inducible GTPase 5-like [Anguilla rostrata]|uniref:interferon-inducible GTPase 5-like n=1 Tax=Anguilla rostrata TaxID=7938 RepID=UPI0030CCDCA5